MSEDISCVVTATLPNEYLSLELYVAVPEEFKDTAEEWAQRFAARKLGLLAHYIPEAKLDITAVRRVS